jgi:hypothetical protein
MRSRRLSGWRRLTALVVVAALLGPIVVLRDPVLQAGARAWADELLACIRHGEGPRPRPDVLAALRTRLRESAPRQDVPDIDPPIVRPKAALRTVAYPHPDRPRSVPRRVVVAVIDSGVNAGHQDIDARRVLPGVDLVNPCGDGRQDVTGHGTAVAGVLLSNHHGAAPQVDVLPIRISLATGRHSSLSSALGIWVATRRGADVINMSYTAQRRRPSLLEWLAVRYAHSRGVALVAAAGNDPTKPAGFPAAYREVLSVTAVDGRGELSPFAARTGNIDVAAPGSRVLTLSSEGAVRVASGTSLSAPLVSASLAQMLRADPSVSPAQAVATLQEASRPGQPEQVVAHRFGTLNFTAALAGICALSSACQLRQLHGVTDQSSIPPSQRSFRAGEPL